MHSMLHRSKKVRSIGALLSVLTLALVFTGCGNSSDSSAASGPKGCKNIGVLLPETNSSPRWEAYDHPLLEKAIKDKLPGANVMYNNAGGDTSTQQSQADSALTKGACILVVGAHDSDAAAAIVTAAQKQNVPVIAYDRLIQSDTLNYYVSFDNVKVGELQGQYLVDHYKDYVKDAQHNNIAFILGSPTDNNAKLFAEGAHKALDPLIKAGTLNNVYEQFTPNWDAATGQQEMEAALTKASNNISLVLASNDDLAGGVLQALKPQNLAGKVLTTGQDATIPGLQRIMQGTQGMTVYKPIADEANATAELVAAISNGTDTKSLVNGQTQTKGGKNIPSVLKTPKSVDKTNIKDTVLADGFVTKADLCKGLEAGTGGIC